MGFEEFLPDEVVEDESEGDELVDSIEAERNEKIGQTQVYDIITSRKPDWQTIIYDLINSEQLDPWDIDIVVLTRAYFEKILELEKKADSNSEELAGKSGLNSNDSYEPDFYISSKVLLAAALLLRIKSEFLLNKHIKSIDNILFGKKEENKYVMERILINEDDLPILIPKTPMSRLKKVTLTELMNALNKAIETESRRIRKEVQIKRAKKLSEIDFPVFRRIDLKDRIKQFYARILTSVKKKQSANNKSANKEHNKLNYHHLTGSEREEKIACFLPLLHLSNNQKLWLEQENHLEEICIFLYEYFDKNRDLFIEVLNEMEDKSEEVSNEILDSEDSEINEKSSIEKAREKMNEKRKLAEDARMELEKELGWDLGKIEESVQNISDEVARLEKDVKIDEVSGFSDE